MTARRTVLIADAEPTMRMGVRMAIERGGFTVSAEAASADEALALALRERPDVCLVDLLLPGGGIDTVQAIAQHLVHTRIVVLSAAADERDLLAAVRAGADGYLLKDIDPERLPAALRGVIAGESAVPRSLMPRIIERLRALEAADPAGPGAPEGGALTAREAAIVDLLREGRATSEIAGRLGISPVTVRRHISQIVRKLGVADREAALSLLREREAP